MANTLKAAGVVTGAMRHETGEATLANGAVTVSTSLSTIHAAFALFSEDPTAPAAIYTTVSSGDVTYNAGNLSKTIHYTIFGSQ